VPGQVAFAKLVTAEVLIDVTNATQDSVKITFLVKNEELPLNSNNHCRQMFDLLRSAIVHNYDWQPIASLQQSIVASTKSQSAPPQLSTASQN
jgi:hypothetical protein